MAPTPLSATPKILWPPDHQMVKVTIEAPPGSFVVSVTSSEPERGQGRKDVGPDSRIIGPLTVKLRAERGSAEGRIYTLLVQLADGSRNIAVVQVPHDRDAHCHRKPKVHSGRRH
ncbi:MAG: hypothetical protein RIS76_4111 [Verrucomicrobiota bacterium]|jgi:hypothetical protein